MSDPKPRERVPAPLRLRCETCHGTEFYFHEYVGRRFNVGAMVDGVLVFGSESDEVLWDDCKEGAVYCKHCDAVVNVPCDIDFN